MAGSKKLEGMEEALVAALDKARDWQALSDLVGDMYTWLGEQGYTGTDVIVSDQAIRSRLEKMAESGRILKRTAHMRRGKFITGYTRITEEKTYGSRPVMQYATEAGLAQHDQLVAEQQARDEQYERDRKERVLAQAAAKNAEHAFWAIADTQLQSAGMPHGYNKDATSYKHLADLISGEKVTLTDSEVAVLIDSLAFMRDRLETQGTDAPNVKSALGKVCSLMTPSTNGVTIQGVEA